MNKYEVLYKNGKFFTSDNDNPYAEAMVVKDGKISWIGMLSDAPAADKTVDLKGRRVLPDLLTVTCTQLCLRIAAARFLLCRHR